MIDDMASLKQAMDQMDAEDPTVAQAAKDRAAQILAEAQLSFSKLAELIQQRRLLLQPSILARIKRMDQPGMLGDAAFRDTSSALRKERQSFLQIAEALESTGRLGSADADRVQASEPRHRTGSAPPAEMVTEPDEPSWLTLAAGIVSFPLRHPLRFLMVVLVGLVLFYGYRGVVTLRQQVSRLFDSGPAVGQSVDKAMSSVSSFLNQGRSREATAPPTPPAPIPTPAAPSPAASPAVPAPAPPSAPAASATEQASSAPPPAAAPPLTSPASPPASTSRRDGRGAVPSRSTMNCGGAREGQSSWSRRCPPVEDDRRPRTFEDILPEAMRRNSRLAGPCIGGVGGCYWGGNQR